MLCQNCGEDYEFEGFKLDYETGRAFGSFVCGCCDKLVLPEEDCIRLELLDPESKQQLRSLRLFSLSRRLEKGRGPNQVFLKALRAHQSALVAYLADLSSKGLLNR